MERGKADELGHPNGTATAMARLPARQAYLDGELCGIRSDGTDGHRRRSRIKRMAHHGPKRITQVGGSAVAESAALLRSP
jgi:hypothetical protein